MHSVSPSFAELQACHTVPCSSSGDDWLSIGLSDGTRLLDCVVRRINVWNDALTAALGCKRCIVAPGAPHGIGLYLLQRGACNSTNPDIQLSPSRQYPGMIEGSGLESNKCSQGARTYRL